MLRGSAASTRSFFRGKVKAGVVFEELRAVAYLFVSTTLEAAIKAA